MANIAIRNKERVAPFGSLQRDREVLDESHSEAEPRRKFPRADHLDEGKKATAAGQRELVDEFKFAFGLFRTF